MINEIYIIDDILEAKKFVSLQNKVFSSELPWFFTNGTSYKSSELLGDYQFNHPLHNQNGPISALFDDFIEVSVAVANKANIEIDSYARITLICTSHRSKKSIFPPHIDWTQPHLVVIYYLNSCNGETLIYDQTYDPSKTKEDGSTYSSVEYLHNVLKDDLTLHKKIKPVQNRAVVFNGLKYHTGSYSTNSQRRIVANIGFVPK